MRHDELIGNVYKSYVPKKILEKVDRTQTLEVYDLKGKLKAVFTRNKHENEENKQ